MENNKQKEGFGLMKVTVNDMTCGHGKMTIEKALGENGIKDVKINLDDHTVEFDLAGKTEEEAVAIIEGKGYTVTK